MTLCDQFTRFCCTKCGQDGIDSWNKAVWDGPGFKSVEEIPNPWILGMECMDCVWPCVVMYTAPGAVPRAIFGPLGPQEEENRYAYEDQAFRDIETDLSNSIALTPSLTRDSDWSGGCLAARALLQ